MAMARWGNTGFHELATVKILKDWINITTELSRQGAYPYSSWISICGATELMLGKGVLSHRL